MIKKINDTHEAGDKIIVNLFGREMIVKVVANPAFSEKHPYAIRYEASGIAPAVDINKLLQAIGQDLMPFELANGIKNLDDLRSAVAAEIANNDN